MRKLLLNGSDASGIFALHDVLELLGQCEKLLLDNLPVFNHVYCDCLADYGKDIKVKRIDVALNFHKVLFTELSGSCILNNGNAAVEFIKSEMVVDRHALSCRYMVKYISLFNLTYIQHNIFPPVI